MLMATLLFTFNKVIETRLRIMPATGSQNSWNFLLKASFTQFVISLYGGFSGLGTGFLMLASLTLLGIRDIHQINALKVLMMFCMDSLAVIAFLVAGGIAWQHTILVMLGTAIGGYSSAYYAKRLEPEQVRYFIMAIAWGVTCYLFVQSSK